MAKELACRYCDRVFTSYNGRSKHEKRYHHKLSKKELTTDGINVIMRATTQQDSADTARESKEGEMLRLSAMQFRG